MHYRMKMMYPLFACFGVFAAIVSAPPISTALAAAQTRCNVAVCDVTQAVSDFETAEAGVQYATLTGYIADSGATTDPKSLQSLLAFAAEAKSFLSISKASKQLMDAGTQLFNNSVIRLAKYNEVKGDELVDLFKRLPYEGARFEVLQWWADHVKEYEDQGSLLELANFFSGAGKASSDEEDDDYVVALAKLTEKTVETKLFRMQPIFEGVYATKVTCTKNPNCAASQIDKLVIMDTLVMDNTEADLVVTKYASSVYRFQNIVFSNGGTTLEALGRSGPNGVTAKLHLDYDLNARTAIGSVIMPDETLMISAKADAGASVIDIFNAQLAAPLARPLSPKAFEKTLVGTYRGKAVTLKINVFKEDSIGATMTFNTLPGYKLHFFAGRFFPKTGLLLLVASPPVGGNIKFALRINVISFGDPVAQADAELPELSDDGSIPAFDDVESPSKPTMPGASGDLEFEGIAFGTENAVVNPLRFTTVTATKEKQ